MARKMDVFDEWLIGGNSLPLFEPPISARRRKIIPEEDSIINEKYHGSGYAKEYQLEEDKALYEVSH